LRYLIFLMPHGKKDKSKKELIANFSNDASQNVE
jgi:hypothetical protein